MSDTTTTQGDRPRDPRLGRKVWHDPQSRRFAVRRSSAVLSSVRHERHVPVFDQGDLGSCTGNAAVGCMATGRFHATVDASDAAWLLSLDEAAARECYSRATLLDPFDGSYPPDDTGSTGLAVAKVLHQVGAISGYRHAFGIDQALSALMAGPVIVGTAWWSGMYEPAASGLARRSGRPEGGHEYVMDEYAAPGFPYGPLSRIAAQPLVGFTNSWGSGWGASGRFYLPVSDFARLLADQGDVTVFVPSTEAPPVPADV